MEAEDIIINERDEIQAMLGKNPGCLVHFGIPLLFGLLLALLALGWFVQYPDVVSAPVTITSNNPPVRLVARSSGKLLYLGVHENDAVQAGQVLAEIESGARGKDVEKLKSVLHPFDSNTGVEFFSRQTLPQELQLGQIQNTYAALVNAQHLLQLQLRQDIVFRQISSIDKEIEETHVLIESLQRQADILREDFKLAEKELERQRQLYAQNLISIQEFEKTNSAYLRQKQQLESFTSSMSGHRVKIRQLETQQSQLRQGRSQEVLSRWGEIREIIQNLQSEIAQWESAYLVKSPVSGRVVFSAQLTEQQFIRQEQELFSIATPQSGKQIIALAALPQASSGKVKTGQLVKIRLDGFPYQEFGVLEGRVASIAEVPTDNNYPVRIELPSDLRTSARKAIPYKPESKGVGNFITQKRNLLQRIFEHLFHTKQG